MRSKGTPFPGPILQQKLWNLTIFEDGDEKFSMLIGSSIATKVYKSFVNFAIKVYKSDGIRQLSITGRKFSFSMEEFAAFVAKRENFIESKKPD